jgi:hypothetical protein
MRCTKVVCALAVILAPACGHPAQAKTATSPEARTLQGMTRAHRAFARRYVDALATAVQAQRLATLPGGKRLADLASAAFTRVAALSSVQNRQAERVLNSRSWSTTRAGMAEADSVTARVEAYEAALHAHTAALVSRALEGEYSTASLPEPPHPAVLAAAAAPVDPCQYAPDDCDDLDEQQQDPTALPAPPSDDAVPDDIAENVDPPYTPDAKMGDATFLTLSSTETCEPGLPPRCCAPQDCAGGGTPDPPDVPVVNFDEVSGGCGHTLGVWQHYAHTVNGNKTVIHWRGKTECFGTPTTLGGGSNIHLTRTDVTVASGNSYLDVVDHAKTRGGYTYPGAKRHHFYIHWIENQDAGPRQYWPSSPPAIRGADQKTCTGYGTEILHCNYYRHFSAGVH